MRVVRRIQKYGEWDGKSGKSWMWRRGVSWWYFPDAKLGLRAPQAPTCNIHHVPKTWKLRGSGLWGPEQTDVLKLILWNRKRQWRPQREVRIPAPQS